MDPIVPACDVQNGTGTTEQPGDGGGNEALSQPHHMEANGASSDAEEPPNKRTKLAGDIAQGATPKARIPGVAPIKEELRRPPHTSTSSGD